MRIDCAPRGSSDTSQTFFLCLLCHGFCNRRRYARIERRRDHIITRELIADELRKRARRRHFHSFGDIFCAHIQRTAEPFTASDSRYLHGFSMSEASSLDVYKRQGYSIRTKHPEIKEKVKGVFAHSIDRILPSKKNIELNTIQKNHHPTENISHVLKRINSVYNSLNYSVINPEDIEAWWQDTDWKEKEGLPYDHYYITALILKNGHTLFIFDRRPVLTEDEIRYW